MPAGDSLFLNPLPRPAPQEDFEVQGVISKGSFGIVSKIVRKCECLVQGVGRRPSTSRTRPADGFLHLPSRPSAPRSRRPRVRAEAGEPDQYEEAGARGVDRRGAHQVHQGSRANCRKL